MPGPLILYLLGCCIVGLIGSMRRIGFWGGFFAAMAITPLGGLVVAIVLGRAKKSPRRR